MTYTPLSRFASSPLSCGRGDNASGRPELRHGVRWRGLFRGLPINEVLA